MQDDDMKDRMRNAARTAVKQWEETFLKPDPKTYICQRLKAVHEGRHPVTGQQIPPELKDILGRALIEAREADRLSSGDYWAEVQNLTQASESTAEFECLLNELSLDKRPDLSEIVECFSPYQIVIEIRRDSISATYSNSFRCGWQIICRGGNVVTSGRTIQSYAKSQLGPITPAMHDCVLLEVYAFLVLVADSLIWHSTGGV